MDGDAFVIDIVVEIVEEEPPQLFDLTGLQKEANARYGLSAEETLNCAQSLYEDGELSYPRTSSHSITPDMEHTVAELLSSTEETTADGSVHGIVGGTTTSGTVHSGTDGAATSGCAHGSVEGTSASSFGSLDVEGTSSGKSDASDGVDSPRDSARMSPEDAAKLEKWTNRPDDEKYIANKAVYDNPKYFDQESGEERWPGTHGDKNVDGFVDGKYDEKDIDVGHKIDRYGGNNGTFFGETGTPIEKRAMSPNSNFDRYNQYEVIRAFPVREGKIAPWFDKPGGGTQFKIDPSFEKDMRSKLRPGEQLIDGMVRMRYLNRV